MKSEHSNRTQRTYPDGLTLESPQLLSLLALAAGAVMMPQTSEADVIYTNLVSPEVVTPGSPNFVIDNLPGTAQIGFAAHTATANTSATYFRWITVAQAAGYVRFKTQASLMVPLSAGRVWGTIAANASVFGTAARWTSALFGGRNHAPDSFTDKYYAFRFRDSTQGNALRYGWIKVDLNNSNGHSSGPDLTVYAWAYDTTGAQLPMGQGVPEPSSAALLALGALALGAKGLRNWRRNRPTASQS